MKASEFNRWKLIGSLAAVGLTVATVMLSRPASSQEGRNPVDWNDPANWNGPTSRQQASRNSSVPAIPGQAPSTSYNRWPDFSRQDSTRPAEQPTNWTGGSGTQPVVRATTRANSGNADWNAINSSLQAGSPGGVVQTRATGNSSPGVRTISTALPQDRPPVSTRPAHAGSSATVPSAAAFGPGHTVMPGHSAALPGSSQPDPRLQAAAQQHPPSASGGNVVTNTDYAGAGGSSLPPPGNAMRQSGLQDASGGTVVQARANEWQGPVTRPVDTIRQVNFEAIPDTTDPTDVTPEQLLTPYAGRAAGYPDRVALPVMEGQLQALPPEYAPWWTGIINRPLRADLQPLNVDVDTLILKAVEHSPQVTAMRIDPIIRELSILEEEAEFDWSAFVESTYDDASDPVGNALTVGSGGGNRFNDHRVSVRGGLKKKFDQGAEIDVSQRVGYQDNNSTFFTPTQQGTSRVEINFTQPLLRGAGDVVNQSRIVEAMLDHDISKEELAVRLQDHLVSVYEAYWTLYRARAVRLQKERLLRRAQQIQNHLEARQGVDVIRRQILRSRAAVASRRSEIVRADMAIRNAESQLRLLVNSPDLKQQTQVEVLPAELPMSEYIDITLRGSIETALTNRPDISQAIARMKSETLRLGVSRNELLPKLDLVLGVYNSGLRGSGAIDRSLRDQYSKGEPGYSVGLFLEFPLGNRAAHARYTRREWELARSLKEFEATVETAMTEVELAVREMETSYQEMLSRYQAMVAAETEADYLLERWRLLPGNDQTISFLLEDLLDAQERVATEEADFVDAQVSYVLAIVNLKRTSGILLSCDGDNPLAAAGTRDGLLPAEMSAPIPVPVPADARMDMMMQKR